MQSFYKGVNSSFRVNIDAATGGTIMSKTPEDALDLIEEMANTQSLWTNERSISRKGVPIEVDVLTILNVKLDYLSKRIDKMSVNAVSTSPLSSFCELCQERHPTFECHLMQNLSMENISYISNFNGQQ